MIDLLNIERVLQWAEEEAPREACGLLYQAPRGYVIAYKLTNTAKNGTEFFIMDVNEQRELWERKGRPIGVWHSHPGGQPGPSEADLHYHPEGMRMVIVAGGRVFDHGIPGS